MNGDAVARDNIGLLEFQTGNHQRAMKDWIIGARAGYTSSLENVKKGLILKLVPNEEYEQTLRAYQKQTDEMKSEARDEAVDIIAQIDARRSST